MWVDPLDGTKEYTEGKTSTRLCLLARVVYRQETGDVCIIIDRGFIILQDICKSVETW